MSIGDNLYSVLAENYLPGDAYYNRAGTFLLHGRLVESAYELKKDTEWMRDGLDANQVLHQALGILQKPNHLPSWNFTTRSYYHGGTWEFAKLVIDAYVADLDPESELNQLVGETAARQNDDRAAYTEAAEAILNHVTVAPLFLAYDEEHEYNTLLRGLTSIWDPRKNRYVYDPTEYPLLGIHRYSLRSRRLDFQNPIRRADYSVTGIDGEKFDHNRVTFYQDEEGKKVIYFRIGIAEQERVSPDAEKSAFSETVDFYKRRLVEVMEENGLSGNYDKVYFYYEPKTGLPFQRYVVEFDPRTRETIEWLDITLASEDGLPYPPRKTILFFKMDKQKYKIPDGRGVSAQIIDNNWARLRRPPFSRFHDSGQGPQRNQRYRRRQRSISRLVSLASRFMDNPSQTAAHVAGRFVDEVKLRAEDGALWKIRERLNQYAAKDFQGHGEGESKTTVRRTSQVPRTRYRQPVQHRSRPTKAVLGKSAMVYAHQDETALAQFDPLSAREKEAEQARMLGRIRLRGMAWFYHYVGGMRR